MKALVKAKAERGIWMQDIDKPEVGHNDVLIKINRTAICGTDIHIFKWDEWAQATIPVPLAIGHEFYGQIVEMGVEVRGFEVGDRVSAEGHITCGVCRNCRAGRRHLCMNTVQRNTYGIIVRPCWRRRSNHWRGSHRHHGCGYSQVRWCTACRNYRRQRLPIGPR